VAAFLWIVSAFDLFKRRLGAGPTAAWLLVIILFPFAGAIVYWALRKPPRDEVQRAFDTEQEIRRGAPPPRVR
jgi:hypothetical protein